MTRTWISGVGAASPHCTGRGCLTPILRATSVVWWRAAPGGGACPSCVVVLQRRLRHDGSDWPSERRTRWDQQLQHAARTVRGCEPPQPYSVTRQGRWQRPRSRSGGKSKPSDLAGPGRALDGKTRGATLIEQDGAARTTGGGLGQERAGARAEPVDRDHRFRRRLHESLDYRAQQRLPGPPGRTTERAEGLGPREQTWAHTRQRGHGPGKRRTRRRESRPTQEGEGPGPQAGTKILGLESPGSGRKRPTSPNLPSAAFPDFEGDAGMK